MPSVETVARAAGLLLALLAGGCSQYLDRTEGVTTSAGDSIYFNRTQQVIDPYPRGSVDTRIATSGTVVEGAYTRYKTGQVIPPVRNAPPAPGIVINAPINTAPPAGNSNPE
ncbi:hypothetical protein [Prosthecomicrobium sp. N25]|uniref:hypothetical protein n=1 Tax=Prosthecomicrobium sp. N25 TaxID=3129254 RepID=UPI0030782316